MSKFARRYVIIAVTLVVIGLIAYQMLPQSETGRVAVVQLAKVDRFSFGGVGYAGAIPESEELFFTILSSRGAAQLFRELFEQGTPEARLYALAGLHIVDRSRFKECAAQFTQKAVQVQTQSGCIISAGTTAESVAAIEGGIVQRYLKLRKEYAP